MTAVAVSVLIPSYQARRHIEACLASVLAQQLDVPFEVIVVDSSADGTAELVRRRFPAVHVVTRPTKTSAAAARNAGVKVARGELLVFLDADCVAPVGWLAALQGANERYGGVTGGGAAPEPSHHVVGLLLHALSFSEFLPGRPAGRKRFVPSCNLALPRALFDDVGGFPEHLERAEDMAFGERVLAAGAEVWFVRALAVGHAQRSGLHEALRHQWASGFWSVQVRRQHALEGARTTTSALAAASFIVPLRYGRVLSRLLTAQGHRWMAGVWLAFAPVAWLLLGAYAAGFAEGARA